MKKPILYGLWAGLFILCAGLGLIPEPAGVAAGVLTALSLGCFLPPAVLLWQAAKGNDIHTLRLVRNLSALSLGLTAVLLVCNFLFAFGSEALGEFLYIMLVIVSSPMVAGGNWAMSLFFWACLLMAALKALGKH